MSSEVLDADIAALNRQFLNIVTRHSSQGDALCLRLNISSQFLAQTLAVPSAELEKVAGLGTFLLQPVIDHDTLRNASILPVDQGQAHLRSAARLKYGPGR
ncbi:MAG: hypothetical protein PSV26_02625 [Polaromonas sp.]|uniref:hypothetical protein n=1 Tax=Polaromonas sp. TaxID=1869339 RepID=UPI002486F0CB|nr:hypothetical protein [Polaromonas sp.]MDI1236361.1 hypothetical protein [Polaromonas sp.]